MKKLILFLLAFSISGLIMALDDQGNPNDPNENERANACYEDGSMAGKCLSDWDWEAGWYLIRFEYGLLSREAFPAQYAILLPPLPVEETLAAATGTPIAPPPNCYYRGSSQYVNFGSANYLPVGSPVYSDANCSNFVGNNTVAQAYTTAGLADADAICKANDPLTSADPGFVIGNVYVCA